MVLNSADDTTPFVGSDVEISSVCDFGISDTRAPGLVYLTRMSTSNSRQFDDGWIITRDELLQLRRRIGYYIEHRRIEEALRER